MRVIGHITDKDIDVVDSSGFNVKRDMVTRLAARAVVLDNEGKVAVLYVNRKNQYKLPGGGIDEKESIHQGLLREIKEEAGCDVEIEKELGMIIEERHDVEEELGLFQMSFCYVCKLKGQKVTPQFTKKEIKNGFELKWMDPEEALRLNSQIQYDKYRSKFIQKRFEMILKNFEVT